MTRTHRRCDPGSCAPPGSRSAAGTSRRWCRCTRPPVNWGWVKGRRTADPRSGPGTTTRVYRCTTAGSSRPARRGDFEELARRLSPLTGTQTDELGIGVRQVAFETRAGLLQRQDDGEPEFYHDVLAVPTAITRIADPGPFEPPTAITDPSPEVDALHFRLKQLVDIVAGAQPADPIVGPPLYGQWHACASSIDDHPENRHAGARPRGQPPNLGRTTQRQSLSADRCRSGYPTDPARPGGVRRRPWRQLADIATANRRTRWAAMLSASTAVIQTKLKLAPPAVALQLMSPAVTRLRATDGQQTVLAELQKTTLPVEAISAALTRTSRFAVRIGRFAEHPPVTSAIVSTVAEAFADSAKEPGQPVHRRARRGFGEGR